MQNISMSCCPNTEYFRIMASLKHYIPIKKIPNKCQMLLKYQPIPNDMSKMYLQDTHFVKQSAILLGEIP